MSKRIGMEVAIAAAEAVALCRIDVAAVYPITPNTHIAEHLSSSLRTAKSMRNLSRWNRSILQ
jgi:pyruvate/2-oxoacid:ferredoxin oxidoreductase alpha subunit